MFYDQVSQKTQQESVRLGVLNGDPVEMSMNSYRKLIWSVVSLPGFRLANYKKYIPYLALIPILLGAGLLFLFNHNGGDNSSESIMNPPVANALVSIDVVVDGEIKHQVMEGFGATHLPLVYEGMGDVIGAELRSQAVDAIYNQVKLNTGNLEGALLESPGSYDQRSNDNVNPFSFNWSGFQTFTADAMKEKVIDLSNQFGFDDYFLAQKINVRWNSPWLDPIRSSDYNLYLDEAAEQIAAGQIHWRDAYGIIPQYQMPFNEPLGGNDELLNGTTQDLTDIIKRAGSRLAAEGMSSIKFVVPNEVTEQTSLSAAQAILANVDARPFVGAIGYHPYPYGSTYASIPKIISTSGSGNPVGNAIAIRNQLRDLGKQYGVPVWMTEVSHGEVDPLSFDALRGRAIHIHDELIYADASAYYGMLNMWDSVSQELHFGNNNLLSPDNEGNIVFIDIDQGEVYISGMGYAIGHYARWINKGATRIQATSGDPLVQVTAFRDDDQNRLVLIIINNASADRTVNVSVNNLALSGNIIGEQSTSAAYWQSLTPFSPSSSAAFSFTLPAQSVTSIAGQIGAPPLPGTPAPTNTPIPTNVPPTINCGVHGAAIMSGVAVVGNSSSELPCIYLPLIRNQ